MQTETKPRTTRSTRTKDAITDTIDPDKMNKEKVARQKDSATKDDPTPTPEDKKDETASITKDQFEKLMGAVAAGADASKRVEELEQELADAKAALEAKDATKDAEKEELKAEKEKAEGELDFVQSLFSQFGYDKPTSFNPQTLAVGAKMDAATAVAEYESLHRDADKKFWSNADTGQQFEHVDVRKLDRFIREHREEIRDGMEALAKKSGLLRGKDAPTARVDIPQAYLTYMSAIVRMTHTPKFIFWQFANVRVEMGKGLGDTVQIRRENYANTGTLSTDWELTPATPIVATSQAVTMSNVTATLKEYGMGKNATIEPIAIPEFILATSQIELERVVQRNLGYNYNQYEEISARTLWFSNTKTLYNNAGNVVTTPAAALATAATAKYRSGALSYQFLINLYAYLSGQQVPAYMNGCYGLVLHEFALAQLKSSLADKNQYLTPGNMEELTNMFRATTMSEMTNISGYQGMVGNFMIFSTNNISMGAAGTIGAQTETVGGVAQTTRTCFAFGADSIGRGIGMNAQVRRQVEDDFGRSNRWLWIAHEGWVQLDVDSFFAGQQTRVFQLRLTDAEV